MDSLPIHSVPGIREVVCMFCLWTWITGVPQNTAAKCPRCGSKDGVEAFLAVTPGQKGCTLVRPNSNHHTWLA